ncbi:MAG: hypothetical protein JW993_18085 [Sedimentisphaerales bacterium]|nr:hypothetical protein [Sedimentisphaerales bacterium]
MNKANDLVKTFSERSGRLLFADLGTPLLGADGEPDPTLFLDDRLHINARGYALWTKALAPLLPPSGD